MEREWQCPICLLQAREIMMDSLFSQLGFKETEGEREGERERGVLKSPCEESVISQAKCEWLTRQSDGGESRARGDGGMVCLRKELRVEETSQAEAETVSMLTSHFLHFGLVH